MGDTRQAGYLLETFVFAIGAKKSNGDEMNFTFLGIQSLCHASVLLAGIQG